MKQLWYRIGFKSFGAILQGILAGVIIICIMNIYYWTEGSLNFDEMGKNFEQTNVFLQTVEDIVRSKIACQQNKELFERDGAYNNMQEVDIRQYVSGIMDETTLNLNTTYYICDLLEFHENGEEKMRERIQRLLVSGMSDQEVGRAAGRGVRSAGDDPSHIGQQPCGLCQAQREFLRSPGGVLPEFI